MSLEKPNLFVSYSWTDPDHEEWVLQFATELRDSGVDVILDKWDLKEGHDAYAFMEKMVTDPKIKKVILVCDSAYVEKADNRQGGVGKEAQIISGEIYEAQDQDKFVAIVVERDAEGRACLPAYYRSRIYIDLSDSSTYANNFERLLRWIFDKPLYKKPDLGSAPNFLLAEEATAALGTTVRFRRAREGVKNGKDFALGAVTEYLDYLADRLEEIRLDPGADPFDEAVVKSIDAFLTYRNEVIELLLSLSLYMDGSEMRKILHRFFEKLTTYLDRPSHVTQWNISDFDNYRFIIQELFLYTITCLIERDRFDSASYLMNTDYYAQSLVDRGIDPMAGFWIMRQGMPSLNIRKERLKMNRLSLRSDILKERCKGVGIDFSHLAQTDLILYLKSCLLKSSRGYWFPDTLLYFTQPFGPPFEMFARSQSSVYFDRVKGLLGLSSKEELVALIQSITSNQGALPRWEFESPDLNILLAPEKIETRP